MIKIVSYFAPGTPVWFTRGGQEHAGTIEARQGGVYRVKTLTDSYIVKRESVRERRDHKTLRDNT
jgi:hypothetical protein